MIHPAVAVDKYQSVAFDGNRYSVPRPFAFGLVTVKGFVDRVAIVSQGQVVATHGRSLEKSKMILDPLHFLATLDRKPGSLDHAPVFRDWGLPACFADFRARLERQHGPAAGARQYARVLQLLTEHPLTRLSTAIETCVSEQLDTADAVIRRTRAARGDRGRQASQFPDHHRSLHLDAGRCAAARPEPVQPAPGRPGDDSPISVFFA